MVEHVVAFSTKLPHWPGQKGLLAGVHQHYPAMTSFAGEMPIGDAGPQMTPEIPHGPRFCKPRLVVGGISHATARWDWL